ncbi:MAG TPA: FtsX-like permease family protein, partial [Acidimicrobiales bacterium]
MIRLGLRLTLGSGREAAMRVLVTVAAVALGVVLLLACLGGVNGLHSQTDRGAWLDTSAQSGRPTSASNGLWWLASTDQFGNDAIDRIDLAPTGKSAPIPPGLSHLPGPGDYVVSPALNALLRSEPANELRDRYPGRQVGLLGAAALPSPNSLIIVVGHRAQDLSRAPGAFEVGAIQRSAADCYRCQSVVGSGPVLEFVLVVGAVALLLPVLILIATASRLSAARREQRFAAMRLVGATPRQISVVSAVEAVVAATAGVAVGIALFFAVVPLLYHVPFTGAPFATGDLALHWDDLLLVALGVPLAAVVSARIALQRVQRSPLDVKRRAAASPPRIFRLLPLLAGLGLLAYFDAAGKPGAVGSQLLELLVCFTLLVVGLVQAGPWFTTTGARVMARWSSRPSTLLAGRRLLDNPKSAFRFISGLVIALFVASAVVGALSSVAADRAPTGNTGSATLADTFCSFSQTHCGSSEAVPTVPAAVLAGLRTTPGVRGVTVVHQTNSQALLGDTSGVVTCHQLASTPAIGSCAHGVTVANIGYFLSRVLGHNSRASTTRWPSAQLSVAKATSLPIAGVVVATDGSSSSLERVRTLLEGDFPYQGT